MKDDEIKLLNDFSKVSEKTKKQFLSNVESDMSYKAHYYKCEYDFSWLEVMEDTIKYLENIVKEPKVFILNEEEIVQVEKSKKVTVESIIHLCQHSNFVSSYDTKTGDIKPSKVLNVTREETMDIYENRFIYSLINKMVNFIETYGVLAMKTNNSMNNKSLVYCAKTKNDNEHINIKLNIESLEDKTISDVEKQNRTKDRIKFIRGKINFLRNSNFYKNLQSLNVAEVKSPIRKTNIILKNPNFQKAEYLWNFLDRYNKDVKKETKTMKNYSNNRVVMDKLNTAFLINYSIFSNSEIKNNDSTEDINLNYLKSNVNAYLSYDTFITQDQFLKMMKNEYDNIRRNQEKNFKEIRKIIEEDLAYYKDTDLYLRDLMKESS